MDICLMINRVVHSYIHDLPEVTHNAYGYFGYDKPVVEERVYRGDPKIPYYTAKDFSDPMYQTLVSEALTHVNPILEKYNKKLAYEDALHMSIRATADGTYDGKINANCFNVLLDAMLKTRSAKKKDVEVSPKALKELKIKREEVRHKSRPHELYKEHGKVFLRKKDQ